MTGNNDNWQLANHHLLISKQHRGGRSPPYPVADSAVKGLQPRPRAQIELREPAPSVLATRSAIRRFAAYCSTFRFHSLELDQVLQDLLQERNSLLAGPDS
jgi:hypothetical protein